MYKGVCVTAIFKDSQNRILVGSRGSSNRYDFPGGKIEEKDNVNGKDKVLETALFREVEEETGLNSLTFEQLTDSDKPMVTVANWAHHIFLIKSYQGIISNPEHEKHNDWEWLTKEELMQKPCVFIVTQLLNSGLI